MHDSVLELKLAIGKVYVNLAIPVVWKAGFNGETCATNRHVVTNVVVVFVVTKEHSSIDLYAVVEPQAIFLVFRLKREDVVALLRDQLFTVDFHAILIVDGVLVFYLCPHTAPSGECQHEG